MGLFQKLFSRAKPGKSTASGKRGERRRGPRPMIASGTHVLIVEESSTTIASLRQILQIHKFVVNYTMSADAAEKLLGAFPFRLIFVSLAIPGKSALQFLEFLKSKEATRGIPVIAMSQDPRVISSLQGQLGNGVILMRKPFTRGDVFTRINGLIDQRGMPRRF
jgi:DNA-binding response OmpR family regulator